MLLKQGVGHYVGRRWWGPELGITQPRGLHGIIGKKQFTGWVDIAALAAAIPQSRMAQRLSAQGCERDIALIND